MTGEGEGAVTGEGVGAAAVVEGESVVAVEGEGIAERGGGGGVRGMAQSIGGKLIDEGRCEPQIGVGICDYGELFKCKIGKVPR